MFCVRLLARLARDPGDASYHARVWPSPRTTYLNVVSCSAPTGPRACIRRWRCRSRRRSRTRRRRRTVSRRCAARPPNRPRRGRLRRALVLGHDGVGVVRAVGLDMLDRASTPSTTRHGDHRVQIFGAPVLLGRRACAGRRAQRGASPRTAQPAASSAATGGSRRRRAARSTSSVSAAPQTPVRRILALTTIACAFSRSAAAST